MSSAAPFEFDPVTKAARVDEDLRHFPPFDELDRATIAQLPVNIRQELAEVYKTKRAREADGRKRATTVAEVGATTPGTGAISHRPGYTVPERQQCQVTDLPAGTRVPVGTRVDLRSNETIRPAPPVPTIAPAAPPPPRVSFAPVAVAASAGTSVAVAPVVSDANEFEWSQVDHSVLAELPASIQSELRAEARRRQQSQVVRLSGAVGKKRKDIAVLTIAAHFKQMERKQKRRNNAMVASTAVSTVTPAARFTPQAAAMATVQSAHPPVVTAPIPRPPPTISPAPLRATELDPDSSAGPARGFARVDPRQHPERYATATDASSHTNAEATDWQANQLNEHAPPDLAPPPTIAARPPPAACSHQDPRPMPMELDSDSPPVDDGPPVARIKLEVVDPPTPPSVPFTNITEVVAMPTPALGAALPAAPRLEETETTAPFVDPPPNHRDDDAANSRVVPLPPVDAADERPANDPSIAVADDDSPSPAPDDALFTEFESFAHIQPPLHAWLLLVTDPSSAECALLVAFCRAQLQRHRSLETVQAMMKHVRRVAAGTWTSMSDEERTGARAWQHAFDAILAEVQPIVTATFGGRLDLKPFHVPVHPHPPHLLRH